MLDLNTVKITILSSEYFKSNFIFIAIFVIFIILSIIVYAFLRINYSFDANFGKYFLFLIIVISVLLVGINPFIERNCGFNYCEIAVKVVPTERLTLKQIQQTNKFINNDGKYYYIKNIKKPLFLSEDSFFSHMSEYMNQLEVDFNRDIDSMYFKDKIINK